jgi:integrase
MARHGDGLYLRGKDTWYLNCQINGKRYQIKLGKHISKSVAKELALIKRAKILKGEAGIGNKRKDCSFEKAVKEFLQWAQANKRPRTVRTHRECLVHLRKSFKEKQLSQIHPFLIEKHKRSRVEASAPVRANRELATLKSIFNRCRDWELFEGNNPVDKVKYLNEPRRRLRYLEPEEENQLLNIAPEPLRSLIIIGTNTGLRLRAEALMLRWEDIDLKRGLLTVQAAYAKSGQTRTIPLNSPSKLALERLKSLSRGDLVFPKPDGTPYSSIPNHFSKACQRAGLKDVTLHTLRHTFASRLAMAGIDLRTIQELGGWRSLQMVERYSHLSPSHKAQAVEQIALNNSTTLFTTSKKERLA